MVQPQRGRAARRCLNLGLSSRSSVRGGPTVAEGRSNRSPDNRRRARSLVHRLCDQPEVDASYGEGPCPFLPGKSLWQKVRFAKRQAILQQFGWTRFCPATLKETTPANSNSCGADVIPNWLEYPAAIGVAHPCIEAWLLSDAAAITRAMGLAQQPEVPMEPESLPAPYKDRSQNPKVVLGRCTGSTGPSLRRRDDADCTENRDLDAIRLAAQGVSPHSRMRLSGL